MATVRSKVRPLVRSHRTIVQARSTGMPLKDRNRRWRSSCRGIARPQARLQRRDKLSSCPLPCARQQRACLLEMRRIDHFTIELKRACCGVSFECVNDLKRRGDSVSRRGKGPIDDRHLRRMNSHHSYEAIASALGRKCGQAVEVADSRIDRFNGSDTGGVCREQAQRARKLIGSGELAIMFSAGRRTDGCGKIFGTPTVTSRSVRYIVGSPRAERPGSAIDEDDVVGLGKRRGIPAKAYQIRRSPTSRRLSATALLRRPRSDDQGSTELGEMIDCAAA